MLGELAYRIGRLVGTVTSNPSNPSDTSNSSNPSNTSNPSDPSDTANAVDGVEGEGDLLVDSILAAAAGWLVSRLLRPKKVSWPRVVVAGLGATVLSDVVARALGPESEDPFLAYDEDPDALLVRLAAGVAMAAGYAALLYPRLPGPPLAKGLIVGAMEMGAAPHGGLIRVATETPGLKFPLSDLAAPGDGGTDPLANVAFGVALGLLYRPDLFAGRDDDA